MNGYLMYRGWKITQADTNEWSKYLADCTTRQTYTLGSKTVSYLKTMIDREEDKVA